MSNRKALRKLSRHLPTPPEIQKIMDSLSGGSDLSIAILGTAILDAKLERLLTKKFKNTAPKLIEQIFLHPGPLMDFHSKILIALAFGIITTNLAEELHSIRSIRNAFAHAKTPLSFDNKLVAGEISSLRMLNAIKRAEKESKSELSLDNKSWFLLSVKIILIMFDTFEEHTGSGDDALADALQGG